MKKEVIVGKRRLLCVNKTKLKEKLLNLFFFIAVPSLCLTD